MVDILDTHYNVIPEPMSGCWLWLGAVDKDGYGFIRNIVKKSHRYSWELTFGEIPVGISVCHHCDNPPCVNPDHLFLGTTLNNMEDCVAKGRIARGETLGKLTESQVRHIRRSNGLLKDLAEEYGVSFSLIGQIKNRKIWKHI